MHRPRRSTVVVIAQVAVAAVFVRLGVVLAGPPRPDAIWEWALVCGFALVGGLCAVAVVGPALKGGSSRDPRLVVQFAALGAALAFIEVDITVTGDTHEIGLLAAALLAGLLVGLLTRRRHARHRVAGSE